MNNRKNGANWEFPQPPERRPTRCTSLFKVEQTNAEILKFARYLEEKESGPDVAFRADYAGMLLNVIAADDGWAYIIMGQQGYDSQAVWVLKYSPTGPREPELRTDLGCGPQLFDSFRK